MTQTMIGGILALLLSAFALGKLAQTIVVARTFRTRLLIGLAITGMYACVGALFLGSELTPSGAVQSLPLLGLVFAGAAAERGKVLILIVVAILINYAYLHLPEAVFAAGIAVGCVFMVIPSRSKGTKPIPAQNQYPPQVAPVLPQPTAAAPAVAPVMPSTALHPPPVMVAEINPLPKPAPSRTAMLDALDEAIERYSRP